MLHFFRKKCLFAPFLSIFFILFYSPLAAHAQTNVALLHQLLQQTALSPNQTAAEIISMKTGKSLLSKNTNTALMPASNMKVITSAAALSLLKPEFRFKTMLYTDGRQIKDTIQGNLYLKGYGDPVFNDERLRELTQELRYQGVHTITGNLIVDDSYFDAERTGKGWKNTYGAASYSARISALSLNLNTVEIQIRPTQHGQAATIVLKPENTFFEVENHTRTTGGRTQLKIMRQLVDGKNKIIVSGNVYVQGRTEIETINLDKPALYVGNVALNFLAKENIKIEGRLSMGDTPSGAKILASSLSPPLREIVTELNKKSINLIAENLLKFIGANFKGAPGTSEKGAEVVKEKFLYGMVGLAPNKDLVIADGSGLSPLNRLTTHTLTSVLQHMFQQFDVSVDFMSSLAISGVDGTLKKRMNTPALKRRVRAKTGFINGVSALSGYVYTESNEVLIFSFLMNHFQNYSSAVSTQDKLCAELIKWSSP